MEWVKLYGKVEIYTAELPHCSLRVKPAARGQWGYYVSREIGKGRKAQVEFIARGAKRTRILAMRTAEAAAYNPPLW